MAISYQKLHDSCLALGQTFGAPFEFDAGAVGTGTTHITGNFEPFGSLLEHLGVPITWSRFSGKTQLRRRSKRNAIILLRGSFAIREYGNFDFAFLNDCLRRGRAIR